MTENIEKKKDEKGKKLFYKIGWILFLLLLAFIVGGLILPKLVGAVSWPLNKSETCTFYNVTGDNCDSYWCNNFKSNSTLNCSYSDGMCNCLQIIQNITIPSNQTFQNYTINQTEIWGMIGNSSNMTLEQCKAYSENLTMLLKNNVVALIQNISTGLSQQVSNISYAPPENTPWWLIAVGIICLSAVVIAFTMFKFAPKSRAMLKFLNKKTGLPENINPEEYYGEDDKEEDNKYKTRSGEEKEIKEKE
jgi:hypothetical protein